jgi:hypothetical protein
VYVIGVVPVQLPVDVWIVCPCWSVPEMTGAEVGDGAVALEVASPTVAKTAATAAAAATSTARRVRAMVTGVSFGSSVPRSYGGKLIRLRLPNKDFTGAPGRLLGLPRAGGFRLESGKKACRILKKALP